MKKIFLIMILLIGMNLIIRDEYNISDNSIRFRVIANSNSAKDIIMKEKVVKELSDLIFINSDNYNEIEENIYNNLKVIENRINKLFKSNNYDKNINIMYGINKFPKKTYKGKTYKEGNYKSLVIEIGEAKGDNYFCFLYPSLCLIDYEEKINKKSFKVLEILEKYINVNND